MYIEAVSIENYKSFLPRQTLQFEPGFNLLVGTNNAGKTTVLDVIDIDFSLNEPHRSEITIPMFGGHPIAQSSFEVSLATRFSEIRGLTGGTQVYLPVDPSPAYDWTAIGLNELLLEFSVQDKAIKISSVFGNNAESVHVSGDDLVRGVASRQNGGPLRSALFQFKPNTGPEISVSNYGGAHSIVGGYAQLFRTRIYRFSAQRRPGFRCQAQASATLDREAAILPYCINHLQTNDAHGHKILCSWINRVFPSVRWVQATPNGGNFELRCLPHLPEARRDDLATSLASMGAGIGNVIAMFYVVLTAREPQVIAIDEPNAFLHPRALRELLAILEAEGKQHQFILTAHSADVLTAINTKSISLLDFDGVTTTVQQVGLKALHEIRGSLAELGIRMTDLHAKDRVFWVEGQTEELVMQELLRWACPEVASGTSVLRVERTGTFSKKGVDAEEVAKIYERLSSSSALVPPMVCILLDGEKRSLKERQALEISSDGKLRFLDRRMLENYLLHARAIAETLSELECESNLRLIEETLSAELQSAAPSDDFQKIDGAKVLSAIFSKISQNTMEFRKTRDVPTLVSWLLEHDPEHLAPLRVCLRKSFSL